MEKKKYCKSCLYVYANSVRKYCVCLIHRDKVTNEPIRMAYDSEICEEYHNRSYEYTRKYKAKIRAKKAAERAEKKRKQKNYKILKAWYKKRQEAYKKRYVVYKRMAERMITKNIHTSFTILEISQKTGVTIEDVWSIYKKVFKKMKPSYIRDLDVYENRQKLWREYKTLRKMERKRLERKRMLSENKNQKTLETEKG